ncbi:hypothetical protein QWT69_14425 [Sporosarcina oncorhynchi]|uniref:Uncharacterized protein n=1 Tax=Sporosarcina oncorhynchi TaxID=3056444 RepID=A0ABZ0L3J1_9BACL|nr:hypothetical protein [Sporosarcina sp. T2O-4]WOV87053.1 hypothetical protein QWT69_14425 [Sporosarcina sp. T2O-4]
MKKAKVWGILSILVLSLFFAGTVFAADDDLPEPLEGKPSVHHK